MKVTTVFKKANFSTIFTLLPIVVIVILSACKTGTEPPNANHADTTSHAFTWQKIAFSGLTPGCISVINKDDIWIAGVSNGDFSALHWDGDRLQQIEIIDYQFHDVKKYFSDFKALADNDIYFLDGNVFHSDGNSAQLMYARDYAHNEFIQTLWMETPDNIFAAGRKTILHFDGRQWEKMAVSGEDPVVDIWGAYFPDKGSFKIMGLISGQSPIAEHRLFTISNGAVKDTLHWPDDLPASQIWFDSKSPVYVCSNDLWAYSNEHWQKIPMAGTGLNAIHGSAWNNIFVVGSNGLVAHYNGSSWKSYPPFINADGEFESVQMKGKVVAIAGRFERQGYLLIGIQK